MGFKGLVVTDALTMQGLMKLFPEGGSAAAGRAAVEAVKAGNDVLIIPSDLAGSYNGLLAGGAQRGDSGVAHRRIGAEDSARQGAVGLNKAKLVDINAVNRLVATPKSLEVAQEIADEAVTLVRDNHRVLPLKAAAQGTNSPQNAYHSPAENRGTNPAADFHRRCPHRCGLDAGAAGARADSGCEDDLY